MRALIVTAPPAPGLYEGMPAEEYHAVEAMSTGGIKQILRSAAHYKLMRTESHEPTPAMQFGTVVHCGALEPDLFDARAACCPDDAPRKPTSAQVRAKNPSPDSRSAIAWWSDFEREHAGKIILSLEDMKRARATVAAIRAHPGAARLLAGAKVEGSMFWLDGRYKVPCKARYDARNFGGLLDVKTCEDASEEAFARAIGTYKYHVQAAHYCSGAEHVLDESPRFFVMIAAESSPPHGVAVWSMPSNGILAGAHLANIALERYATALSTGNFRGYPDEVQQINLPRYLTSFDL